MWTVLALVAVTVVLFAAAAMWDGPGGVLKHWIYNS